MGGAPRAVAAYGGSVMVSGKSRDATIPAMRVADCGCGAVGAGQPVATGGLQAEGCNFSVVSRAVRGPSAYRHGAAPCSGLVFISAWQYVYHY